jgi:Ca2+-binding EF-hand superfamily protein
MEGRGLSTVGYERPEWRAIAAAPMLAVTFVAVAVGTAEAQPADEIFTANVQERLGFDAADTNGDNFISEAELARDAAAGFSGLDGDHDGSLTPEELGPHDPALFARVDRNGDGVLTFDEIIVHKVSGFEKADRNGDGLVSFDEMVEEAESELGVQG